MIQRENQADNPADSPPSSSRFLRDLEWVIASPSLLDTESSEDVANPVWCPDLEIDAEKLDRFMEQQSSHRVGYYFESLIHYWLKEIRKVEVIEQGKQIIEEGITKGEIDFLFRDEEGKIVHWEVAVKFYLQSLPSNTDGSHLIGPNSSDNYARKHKRLFGRQLELSRKLPSEIDLRQGLVKGRIFYHPDDPQPAEEPRTLNPGHLRGMWICASEIARLDDPDFRYRILKKPNWLGEETGIPSDLPFQEFKKELSSHFQNSPHPLLIISLKEVEEDWRENERTFIVPDHWPN